MTNKFTNLTGKGALLIERLFFWLRCIIPKIKLIINSLFLILCEYHVLNCENTLYSHHLKLIQI